MDDEQRRKNREKMQRWRAANPGKSAEYVKTRYRNLRLAALQAYGNECACCGEKIERFLQIDHIGGGGKQHRDAMGSGNAAFYRWLEANNYPPTLQVLCGNCNTGSHINGGTCPHAGPVAEPTSYISGYRRRIKKEVVDAYGGRCACCSETELTFLTIDHVHNNGAAHRRALSQGRGGHVIHALLKKTGYPDGYQVLCFNCNDGRYFNGGRCPHEPEEL